MANLHDQDYSLKLKQGLVANINTTATKNLAVLGELFYATDDEQLYIFNGTINVPLPALGQDNFWTGTHSFSAMKSGATQGAAGADAYELWYTSGHATLPDNVVMIGV